MCNIITIDFKSTCSIKNLLAAELISFKRKLEEKYILAMKTSIKLQQTLYINSPKKYVYTSDNKSKSNTLNKYIVSRYRLAAVLVFAQILNSAYMMQLIRTTLICHIK